MLRKSICLVCSLLRVATEGGPYARWGRPPWRPALPAPMCYPRFATTAPILLVILACSAVRADDAPSFKVAAEKKEIPASVAEPIKKLLAEPALVVTEGGKPKLSVWLRSEIPSRATAEQIKNGITYRELPEGTVLGVIQFDATFVDFRKQEIPAGVYTLRLAIQPDTGDHTGTAPHTDFALMAPVADDKSADDVELKTLVGLSKKVLNSDHPSVMLLFPHKEKGDGPTVTAKEGGAWVLNFKRPVVAGCEKTALGFSLTIHGYSKTR